MIRRALLITLAAAFSVGAHGQQPPQRPAAVQARVAENINAQAVASIYDETRSKRATLIALADLADAPTAARASQLAERWDRDLGPTLAAMRDFLERRLENPRETLAAIDRRAEQRASELPADPASTLTSLEAFHRGAGSALAQRYLSAFDPRLSSDGVAQLREGVSQTIQTDGSGAGEGLAFTITLPRSWMQGHSRGGGSVVRASSDAGHGPASLVIRVIPAEQDAPAPEPADIVRRAVTDPLGRESASLESTGETTIFGRPAAWGVLSDESTSRWGASRALTKLYAVVVSGAVVKIELAVADRARTADALIDQESLAAEFERLEPLFQEITARLRVAPARE